MRDARVTRGGRRVPLNFFGCRSAWSGWRPRGAGSTKVGTRRGCGEVLFAVAGVCWLLVLAAYARYVSGSVTTLLGDVTDRVAGPFASLALITPLLLAAQWLYPHLPAFGAVVTLVLIGLTVLLGGWYTRQWIYTPVGVGTFHPGYFLPTVAGGLVASAAAARIGQPPHFRQLWNLHEVVPMVAGQRLMHHALVGTRSSEGFSVLAA